MAGDSGYLTRAQHVMRRPVTVREYHRMAETGILSEQDRIELIEGELIAMAPVGTRHAGAAIALDFLLNQALRGRGFVSVQNPLRLGEHNEPQPDIMVLRPRADYYQGRAAGPDDVLLLVKIASSSLEFDRAVKLPLYASHGITEYWIVNIAAAVVETYRTPSGDRYANARTVGDGVLTMALLPDVVVPVADLFRGRQTPV